MQRGEVRVGNHDGAVGDIQQRDGVFVQGRPGVDDDVIIDAVQVHEDVIHVFRADALGDLQAAGREQDFDPRGVFSNHLAHQALIQVRGMRNEVGNGVLVADIEHDIHIAEKELAF